MKIISCHMHIRIDQNTLNLYFVFHKQKMVLEERAHNDLNDLHALHCYLLQLGIASA